MKSSPDVRPEREKLTTLPEEESQAIPSQLVQQSEEDVHVPNNFEGSEVILPLNSSNASLSLAWQDSDASGEKTKRKTISE